MREKQFSESNIQHFLGMLDYGKLHEIITFNLENPKKLRFKSS